MTWPFGASIHFGLIGLVAAIVSLLQGDWSGLRLLRAVSVGVAGMSLFALPAAVLHFTAGKVAEFTSVTAFCAVPLMIVLVAVASSVEQGENQRLRGLMAPSIAGLCGALLLFPIESPGSVNRWLFLSLELAGCVVVAIASVWMQRLMQGVSVAIAVGLLAFGSAIVLGFYGTELGWPAVNGRLLAVEALRCAVFDLPVVWLTVWLIREMNAARLSARFLLVPMITAIEGYVLLRQAVESKTILALLLMGGGGVLLLVRDEPEELPSLRLR